MREIKFRAFDNDPEIMQMFYSDKAYDKNYCFIVANGTVQCLINCRYCDSFGDEHYDWNPLDNIMQYTGLKDKNGKEIYEGDILITQDIEGEKYKTFVTYENGMFLSGEESLYDDVFLFEAEVVGNIYENPELLKV